MKLFRISTLALLLLMLTTGCTENTESPEELTQMPNYDQAKSELYEYIDKKLMINTSLVLPSNSKEVGKINEVDLNGDSKNEIVLFEKKDNGSEEEQSEVGFLVLKEEKDSKGKTIFKDKADILLSGDTIEYANFYDLNDDGIKEIILCVKNGEKTNLHIFKYENDEIEELYTLEPSWLPDFENYNNLKIKIGYIDEDPKLDILMIHHDSKTNTAYVSIANFNKYIVLKDYVKIENVKDLSGLYITLGNIATAKRGVILDIPIAKESSYMTQILYMSDGKLKKAFRDDDKSIVKSYYIPVEDLNNDKVIDIPIVNGVRNAYLSKSSANVTWYKWNGKEDDYSGLVFTSQIYYNYTYNFKLQLPNNLANKITIKKEAVTENASYNFEYFDDKSVEQKTLFTISVMAKVVGDDSKNMVNKTGIVLSETEEYNYMLHIKDAEQLKKLDITTESLVEYFSFIY